MFDKAFSLDRPAFDRQGISGFTAHITHTTDMLANGITNFYGGAVTEPLRILACLGGAWFISWRLTLASLIFAPLAAFLILFLNRRIRALSISILDRSMGFHHVMLEVFNSLLTVQANTMEDFERRRFRESTANIRRIALKATFYNSLSSPVTELLGMGILCTGVIVSGYLVINHETHIFGIPMSSKPLSITLVTVFFAMLVGASDPLRKLSTVITGVNSGMAAAGIIVPDSGYGIALPEPATSEATADAARADRISRHFVPYDGMQPVLESVNLTINRGDHLAIVGPNGGGKSTIINLLCRFYDPQQGDVLDRRHFAPRCCDPRPAGSNRAGDAADRDVQRIDPAQHSLRALGRDGRRSHCGRSAGAGRRDSSPGFPNGYLTMVRPERSAA